MTAPQAQPAEPLAFARALVRNGVPVFACPPGGTADGYHLPLRWQLTQADEHALERWEPGWALAAVCGVQDGAQGGVDVIDLDPRNGGTWESLRAALGPGVELPQVLAMVGTPSGGVHLYVAAQGLGKGPIARGVDYQAGTGLVDGNRSDRGFVWLPPTVKVPKSGPNAGGLATYITTGGFEPGGGVSESFKRWVLEGRAKPASPTPDKIPLSPGPRPDGRVLVGGRDNDATAYAASLRRRGFTWEEAQVAMEARWAGYEQPAGDAYALGDALAKLESAWAKFEAREEPLDTSAGFREPARLALVPEMEVPAGPTPVDWAELWTRTERTDWVVPGIVPAGRGVVLYSAPKTGKSLLALEVAAAVARGGAFLGSECAPGSVVYFDRENDPVGDVRRILVAMGLGPADLGGLHYYSFPRMAQLDTRAGGQSLLDLALGHGAALAIVDTTTRFVGGKEVDPETWAAYFNYTGMIFKEAGIALLRLDHEGKDAERGMRGSSSKAADPDLVWHLERTGDEFMLTCDYSRLRLDVDTYAYRREDEPLRSVLLPGDRTSASLRQDAVKLRAIWEALDAARVPEAAGRPTAQAALRAAGFKADTNLLAAVVAVRKSQGNDFYTYPEWAPERYLSGTQRHVNTVLTPPAVVGEGFK